VVEVLFHDQRGRQRVPHLSDYFGFSMAALGSKARPQPLCGQFGPWLRGAFCVSCSLLTERKSRRMLIILCRVGVCVAWAPAHPAHACMLTGRRIAVWPTPHTEYTAC